ncbi:hypothetical protein MD484_g201, partial [Candolleomyces efflorescens]
MVLSEYERIKQDNIARNKALLQELGLDTPLVEPKEKPRKKAPTDNKKKRKAEEALSNVDSNQRDGQSNDLEEPAAKAQKTEAPEGTRRSSRNAGKKVDYKGEIQRAQVVTLSSKKVRDGMGPLGSEAGDKRKHSPKVYGSIPGVTVGTWWEKRQGCSIDAIHAPLVGGISGGKDGAFSVALSGGYDDDVDLGYAFTYTGSGGRDLKAVGILNYSQLRTAPQSSDQSFENTFNKMLLRSSETHKPVRVIRGYKLKSKYAPSEGYRYDGLYVVEKAWIEKGNNPKGYLVCKYAFKRLPNQPAIQVRDLDAEDPNDQDQDGGDDEEAGKEDEEADVEEEEDA